MHSIRSSIEVNGFYGAVLAQKSTRYILAGNHRFEAALAAGMTKIPVIWADVDDERALRILLADNRTTRLGRDDDEALAALLSELDGTEPGLDGTGFDGEDLQRLMSAIETPDFQPVAKDEQQRLDRKAKSKTITCPQCGHVFTT